MKYHRLHVRRSALWVFVSLCALLMGPGGVAAMSQATPESSGTPVAGTSPDYPDVAAYPGAKLAVIRSYMPDYEAISAKASPEVSPESTPVGATPEGPAVDPQFKDLGMMFILSTVIEFDKASSAESAFPGLVQEIESNAQTEIGSAESPFVPAKIDGIGQEAKAFSLTVAPGSFGSAGFLIVARQENVVYSVYGMALHGEAAPATTAFTTKLVSGTIGRNAPVFRENGTSTGGIWDVFPREGDASLGELLPFADGQIYQRPAAGP